MHASYEWKDIAENCANFIWYNMTLRGLQNTNTFEFNGIVHDIQDNIQLCLSDLQKLMFDYKQEIDDMKNLHNVTMYKSVVNEMFSDGIINTGRILVVLYIACELVEEALRADQVFLAEELIEVTKAKLLRVCNWHSSSSTIWKVGYRMACVLCVMVGIFFIFQISSTGLIYN